MTQNMEEIRDLFTSGTILEYLGEDGIAGLVAEVDHSTLHRLLDKYDIKLSDDGYAYSLPEGGLLETFWDEFSKMTARDLFFTVTSVIDGGKGE